MPNPNKNLKYLANNKIQLPKSIIGLLVVLIFIGFTTGCEENYTPKPRAYFRIDLPEKEYQKFQSDCPYSFEYPVYSKAVMDERPNSEKCWMNLDFPQFDARVHVSYKQINHNLNQLTEESRTLAFKHTIKANDIQEQFVMDEQSKVYGLIYDIKGDAASYLQFFLTDSTNHFLRGSLYFNSAPNYDSISPVLTYVKEDLYKLVNTFEWK